MSRRRILLLTPSSLETINDGTKMRASAAVRGLAATHDVTCLPFDTKYGAPASAFTPLRRLFSWPPSLVRRFSHPDFAREVAHRSAGADLCYIVSLQMVQYVRFLARKMPVILDNYNVESEILRSLARRRPWKTRWFWQLEALKLRFFESWAMRQVDLNVAISSEDARVFRLMAPRARVKLLHPMLDLEPYRVNPSKPVPGRLVFIGTLDWHVNEDAAQWMAREVMPKILAAHPHAHLQVVGRNPSPAVLALEHEAGVEVHGNVPSVFPYLEQAEVVVAPLRYGSGIQYKVVQAMAAGKAIVATPVSATGIQGQAGVHFAIAAESLDFARECCRLLENPSSATAMGRLAQTAALEIYSDLHLQERMSELVAAVMD